MLRCAQHDNRAELSCLAGLRCFAALSLTRRESLSLMPGAVSTIEMLRCYQDDKTRESLHAQRRFSNQWFAYGSSLKASTSRCPECRYNSMEVDFQSGDKIHATKHRGPVSEILHFAQD